jgi:hypothetical protein
MRQHLHSSSLEQHVEELRRANALLRSGAPPPSDQDRELPFSFTFPGSYIKSKIH